MQSPSADQITSALHSTKIPKLDLRDATTTQSIAVVLESVRSQNPELGPVLFEFSYTEKYHDPTNITLLLQNKRADLALQYISALSNLTFTTRRGKIYFHPIFSEGGVPPLTSIEKLHFQIWLLKTRIGLKNP